MTRRRCPVADASGPTTRSTGMRTGWRGAWPPPASSPECSSPRSSIARPEFVVARSGHPQDRRRPICRSIPAIRPSGCAVMLEDAGTPPLVTSAALLPRIPEGVVTARSSRSIATRTAIAAERAGNLGDRQRRREPVPRDVHVGLDRPAQGRDDPASERHALRARHQLGHPHAGRSRRADVEVLVRRVHVGRSGARF